MVGSGIVNGAMNNSNSPSQAPFPLDSLLKTLGLRARIGNCIALHGQSGSPYHMLDFYDWALVWFKSMGYRPNYMGYGRPGHFRGKLLPFTENKRTLVAQENLTGVELRVSRPGKGGIETGFRLTAMLETQANVLVLCFDDGLGKFDETYLKQLVSEMCDFYKFSYGYCFQRPLKLGPVLYAFGISTGIDGYGPVQSDRKRPTAKWFNAGSFFEKSNESKADYLRDIYPFNILSSVHLQRNVEGGSLKDWVQLDSCRGRFEQMNETLWWWAVDPKEIDGVRKALADQQLLVAYRNDVPPLDSK